MIFGKHEQNTLEQFQEVSTRAVRSALMADGHFGFGYPVGGVTAYRNQVSVLGVGVDIACGNAAIRTSHTTTSLLGLTHEELQANPYRAASNPVLNNLADELFENLSFGIGRKNAADDAPVDHPLFHHEAWWAIPNIGGYRDDLIEKARRQLGTIGAGNHYVDVFYDESGRIWVGNHFGSRGLGHTIAVNFMALGQGLRWGEKAKQDEEVILDLDTPMGDAYWRLLQLAGEYAYAGREWVVRKATQLMGATEMELVHNHHNFAWKEQHITPDARRTEELVVVRKGSTPAWPGQRGFVGGSMGDDSVILCGRDDGQTPDKESALYSTVHGAGRVMGRKAALGKVKTRKFWVCGNSRNCDGVLDVGTTPYTPGGENPKCPKCGNKTFKRQVEVPGSRTRGLVDRNEVKAWLERTGVVLRGGDLDEAPQCYRRLPDVLEAQGSTIEVLHTLHPLIVCMAPGDTVDPFKD